MAEEEDPRDNIEVVLEPPDENELSGEDSGDEEGGGYIDNVSSRQLRGNCEVRFISYDENGEELETPADEVSRMLQGVNLQVSISDLDLGVFDTTIPTPSRRPSSEASTSTPVTKRRRITPAVPYHQLPDKMPSLARDRSKKHIQKFTWEGVTEDPSPSAIFPEKNFADIAELGPAGIFSQFFYEEMYTFLSVQANIYELVKRDEKKKKQAENKFQKKRRDRYYTTTEEAGEEVCQHYGR